MSASPIQLSPETTDFIERLREHYRQQGKAPAAASYARHLRHFFAWAESNGYGLANLPSDAVESFLASTGQKDTTTYVMRTQIKSALREAHTALGVDFAHLEYQTGKPREVRQIQKAKEKEKRAASREGGALVLPFNVPTHAMPVYPQPLPQQEIEPMPIENTPADTGAATHATPSPTGVAAAGSSAQPVVFMQVQQPKAAATATAARPTNTASTTPRGIVINNHTFTGAFVKISRIADGSEPFIPPGTETFITTMPASQLAPHGDIAAFLQQYVLRGLRLPPTVGQVQFVFHELNDRRQPTGRRDEMVVAVPFDIGGSTQQVAALPAFNGVPTPPAPTQFDKATEYLFKRMDDEAAAAKQRAEKLSEELAKAKDAQTTMMLMAQLQRENDNRRDIEERRMQEFQRQQQAQAMQAFQMQAPAYAPAVEVLPKVDPATEMIKAFAESQSRMMEALMVRLAAPAPVPAPVQQKDATEWLVPFLGQMNQQAMQQQQANQQMLLGVMQSNQQFMQALVTRESPEVKLIRDELREVRQQANAPKGDEVEDFAEKLQKMKVVGEMLMGGGGGGGGGGGLIDSIIANAETIGAGVAKIVSAARPSVQLPQRPQFNGGPVQQVQALPPAPQEAQPQAQQPQQQEPLPPPTEAIDALNAAAAAALAEPRDDQKAIDSVVAMVTALKALPHPYPRIGDRILEAFKQVEDDDDLFSVGKHLYVAVNQKIDKRAARAIADVFYKWFPLIHMTLFGETRFLVGQSEEEFNRLMSEGLPQTASTNEAGDGGEVEEVEEEEDGDESGAVEASDDGVINTQADVAGAI